MAFALKLDTTSGFISQFIDSDALELNEISQRTAGADMKIGANLGAGDELQLGKAGEVTRVLGDLTVDGSEVVSTDETVTGTFTANGDVNLGSDDGDAIALGGGTSDAVTLMADLVLGAGLVGIGSSVTDYLAGLWLQAVNDNGPDLAAYDLRASGTNAGAYSIGVDPSLLANASSTDLMTALDELDQAISDASGTLQESYEAGNTIAVTSAEGTLDFSNDTATDTTTVLEVSRTPASATGGIAVQVTMGANATGTALEIDNAGSGAAIDVQDGGSSVLKVDGAGKLDLTPTSGQDLAITIAGAGKLDASAAGGIELDAAAVSYFRTSAGNLTLDAAAAELVFDDVGGSGLTLSQSSDRTLDETGTAEIFEGVTSIVGALNALADVAVQGPFQSRPIENGVTIAAGDCVAQSTTSGRVTLWNGDELTNPRFVGIAITGGTGDAGGTVFCKIALPGSLVTDSGASWLPGAALFGPEGTGKPVALASAPNDAGDAFLRVGWAHTSTSMFLEPGATVILG